MSKRNDHAFAFEAQDIARAAFEEAEYHDSRVIHWQDRADKALETVHKTIGAKVVEYAVTNGKEVNVVVDYGDPEAWSEYKLASSKINRHTELADRFKTDHHLYKTQGVRSYDLDSDDVHHFRLNGVPRED